MATYPSGIKTFTHLTDGVDNVMASHQNEPNDEITAIETELGINPKGSDASVKERLDRIEVEYVSTSGSDVITAKHSFEPSTPGAPFTVSSSGSGVVTNLNADMVDGSHASSFATSSHDHAATYAPIAKGVTNGDSHDHVGGDGGQIDHTGLSNLNSASYTHLTAANHTDLTDGGATTLHKHDHTAMDNLNSSSYTHLTAANHTDLTDGGATTLHKHDHGGQDGLADDDHTQYFLASGARDIGGNVRFDYPGTGYSTRDVYYDSDGGGLRIYPGSTLGTSPPTACIQFWNNSSSLPGRIYFDSGAHDSAAIIMRTTGTSGTITERVRINASGHIIPGANKTYNLGATGSRFNTLYIGTSTAAGTSRLVKSKKKCPVCNSDMVRGSGSLCILGEESDYEVAMCPSCGVMAAEEMKHLPEEKLAMRRQPPKIEFLGFHVFAMSGNSRKVRVDFRYIDEVRSEETGIAVTKAVENPTYFGETELEEYLALASEDERMEYLYALGLREWEALEEVRLMEEEVASLQARLDGTLGSLKNADIYARKQAKDKENRS